MTANKTPTILAIDTSGMNLQVGLQTEAGVFLTEIHAGTTHSEFLLDAVDKLFELADVSPADMDVLATMKGPGSFTGLRIGFAAIKGIALALDKKMVSVPTLDCAAFAHRNYPGLVLPVLDAKQKRFFAALYRNGERLTDYLDERGETLAALIQQHGREGDMPVLLSGGGADIAHNALAALLPSAHFFVYPAFDCPLAGSMLQYIQENYTIITCDEFFAAPFYIRASDAEINAEKLTRKA